MNKDALAIFRIIFSCLFFIILFAGIYLMKNYDRFFGADPSNPGEKSSERSYSATMIFAIWVHAVIATGSFALFLR